MEKIKRKDGIRYRERIYIGGQEYALAYTGNFGTNSTIGGNDIVLTAIPEPGTWGMIFGGFRMLTGIQRLRKRRVGGSELAQSHPAAPPMGIGGAVLRTGKYFRGPWFVIKTCEGVGRFLRRGVRNS